MLPSRTVDWDAFFAIPANRTRTAREIADETGASRHSALKAAKRRNITLPAGRIGNATAPERLAILERIRATPVSISEAARMLGVSTKNTPEILHRHGLYEACKTVGVALGMVRRSQNKRDGAAPKQQRTPDLPETPAYAIRATLRELAALSAVPRYDARV